MNIQINCNEKVSEDSLRFIFHNKNNLIKEYQENKNNSTYTKYISGKQVYFKHLKGSFMLLTNIEMTCNGKTMYFKIKEEQK